VSFEPGAKLSRIGDRAFAGCPLRGFTIPGQLEILELEPSDMFMALDILTFDIPSRIRRLCLPYVCVDRLCIPDSVEFLSGSFETVRGRAPLLQFNAESRLMDIDFDPPWRMPYQFFFNLAPAYRVFVCLPEEVLRRFRFRFDGL
jgi:hypothetical protein